jgi:hypothetical protein
MPASWAAANTFAIYLKRARNAPGFGKGTRSAIRRSRIEVCSGIEIGTCHAAQEGSAVWIEQGERYDRAEHRLRDKSASSLLSIELIFSRITL